MYVCMYIYIYMHMYCSPEPWYTNLQEIDAAMAKATEDRTASKAGGRERDRGQGVERECFVICVYVCIYNYIYVYMYIYIYVYISLYIYL